MSPRHIGKSCRMVKLLIRSYDADEGQHISLNRVFLRADNDKVPSLNPRARSMINPYILSRKENRAPGHYTMF